jgi:hypothetical protein
MRFKIFLVPIFLFILNSVTAQVNDTIGIQSDESAERITGDLDSLVNNWYVKMAYSKIAADYQDDTASLPITDSVYIDRLSHITISSEIIFRSILSGRGRNSVRCSGSWIIIFQ